ncbi:MAG: hypothetical protein OXD31_04190 [Chloroflexi bacterium]|nr:hypothetical protein [Chloroflexota bacterium]
MCAPSRLQQHIRNLTNDGEVVAQFLVDTVQGKTSGAKACHQMEAAKLLNRYGLSDQPEQEESQFWGLIPTPEELAAAKDTPSPSTGEGWDGGDLDKSSSPSCTSMSVSHLDILNYDIAHLIRQETAEGHTIAEFLSHVMTRRDQPFTPKKLRIKHTDRMAAAREILRRGHGHWGRKPKLKVYADDVEDNNDYDTLHTDLAKRMREYNEHGTDAIRFLLEVMSDTSLDPEEGYTWHHKMSAAHEIIRRGWDTNYDKITPEMLQAYWQDQQSTRLSVGQKKQLAGLPTFLDEYDHYDHEDYQAIADAIRDQEDRAEAADFKSASAPGKSPLSPGERVRVRGSQNTSGPSTEQRSDEVKHDNTSSPSCTSMSVLPDNLDCYYEPLTPEDQAIFNYNSLIESGEFEEGEITFVPPSEEAHRDYAIALSQIREAAEAEGIPLLPNPLAGTLQHPNIRSP